MRGPRPVARRIRIAAALVVHVRAMLGTLALGVRGPALPVAARIPVAGACHASTEMGRWGLWQLLQ